MKNFNPKAFVVMWALTLLMVGAIALGVPAAIYAVGGVLVVFTIFAVL